jgi:hypothetical protein
LFFAFWEVNFKNNVVLISLSRTFWDQAAGEHYFFFCGSNPPAVSISNKKGKMPYLVVVPILLLPCREDGRPISKSTRSVARFLNFFPFSLLELRKKIGGLCYSSNLPCADAIAHDPPLSD